MAGPTPVSAYLHSATMVKAGIYLLARMHPMLGDTWLWNNVVTAFGLATMLLGAIATLGQKDLKRILAYSTLAVLGTLVMLIGIGHRDGDQDRGRLSGRPRLLQGVALHGRGKHRSRDGDP